jgi:hypothetical protein
MANYRLEVLDCLNREREERAKSLTCATQKGRDQHLMLAERHADRAWSLAEACEAEPYVPSDLWSNVCA